MRFWYRQSEILRVERIGGGLWVFARFMGMLVYVEVTDRDCIRDQNSGYRIVSRFSGG